MLRYSRVRWLLLLLIVLVGGTVTAREVLQDERCYIGPDEVIEGTLYIACQELQLEGRVTGHVIGFALRGSITGTVEGNVYLISGQMALSGLIEGDMHFAGPLLNVQPSQVMRNGRPASTLQGNLFSLAFSTQVAAGVTVPQALTGAGYQLIIDGVVLGEVNFAGSALIVNGVLAGDIFASVGSDDTNHQQFEALLRLLAIDLELRDPGLVIGADAVLIGQLSYESQVPHDSKLDGLLLHAPQYIRSAPPLPSLEPPQALRVYGEQVFREITGLLIVGVVGLLISPGLVNLPLRNIRWRPFSSLSVGLLAFIVSAPVLVFMIVSGLLILLALNAIGLQGVAVPVAIVGALLTIGGGGVFYFVAIFVARALIALGLGRLLWRILMGRHAVGGELYACLLLGVVPLALVVSLPVLGFVINGAALFLGLGAIMSLVLTRFQILRETNPISPIPQTIAEPVPAIDAAETDSPPKLPEPEPPSEPDAPSPSEERREVPDDVPVEEDTLRSPQIYGTENLPDGFDFSFFEDDDR